jgi:cytochrome P450
MYESPPRESITDPALLIAELRERDPVYWVPGFDAWVVTRHEDARLLFADPRVTADPRVYEGYEPPTDDDAANWLAEMPFRSNPAHADSLGRRLVAAALSPRAAARTERSIQAVVEEFAAPLRERRGVVDLIGEFTAPVSSHVIGRILGVPPRGDDTARFVTLGRKVTRAINPFLAPEKRRQTERGSVEIGNYVLGLIKERRANPQADLISDLVRVSTAEAPATDMDVARVIAALVSAGTGTASLTAARSIRSLLRHPEQLATLRADRSLLTHAIEELMRYDSGVFGMPRYVKEDFELRGKSIRRGQLMVLSLMGANRDPRAFPEPDRLDLQRDTSAALSFGFGPHYCIGANLARVELRLMIDAALDFIPPGAVLLEDQIKWSAAGFLSQIRSLPVDFGG